MGVDEAVMVAAGNAALEPGLLQMPARPIDPLLRHAGNGAIGRTVADLSRSDLDDAADTDVLDSSRIDAGNVVGAAINAIDDEGQIFAEFVGEMLVDNAADDRRRGRAVVNPEARRIAREALRLQRLVHRLDDVAALAQFAQGRLQFFAQLPAARRGLAGKPHSFQLAKPGQPQRAVGDAARIGRRVPEVHETLAGLGDQRPIDAGEAVLIDLGRELALLLDCGDRTEFEGHQFACPLANAMGDVVAIDDQILAQLISAVDDDMNMRMAGIKMVHRDPIELRFQVTFEFAHEVAGEAREITEAHTVLRRDDDAELVAIVLATIEEGIAVGPVLRRRIQPAALAIARGAVALNITQMSGGSSVLPGGTNGARFDHDAPGARLTVAPSAFAQGAGANEGSAAPTSHADLAARSAARPATRSMRGCARRPCAMLAGDLADPGEKALGGRTAAGVGADAAKPRTETIFVILAHRHRSRWPMQKQNKTTHSAAKSRANIDVSHESGTAPPSGRCRAPSPNQCADHGICARWPGMVPSALILPSAPSTVCALPPIAVSESSL